MKQLIEVEGKHSEKNKHTVFFFAVRFYSESLRRSGRVRALGTRFLRCRCTSGWSNLTRLHLAAAAQRRKYKQRSELSAFWLGHQSITCSSSVWNKAETRRLSLLFALNRQFFPLYFFITSVRWTRAGNICSCACSGVRKRGGPPAVLFCAPMDLKKRRKTSTGMTQSYVCWSAGRRAKFQSWFRSASISWTGAAEWIRWMPPVRSCALWHPNPRVSLQLRRRGASWSWGGGRVMAGSSKCADSKSDGCLLFIWGSMMNSVHIFHGMRAIQVNSRYCEKEVITL